MATPSRFTAAHVALQQGRFPCHKRLDALAGFRDGGHVVPSVAAAHAPCADLMSWFALPFSFFFPSQKKVIQPDIVQAALCVCKTRTAKTTGPTRERMPRWQQWLFVSPAVPDPILRVWGPASLKLQHATSEPTESSAY